MESGPAAAASMDTVPAGSRAWWAYSSYVVFALGVALLLVTAYIIVTSPGLFKVDLPGALLGIAAFLIGLAIMDRLPRDVQVTSDFVRFRYILSQVTLRWDQLAAPTIVGKGFVAFRAATGARGVWGSLLVTAGQAEKILSYPACPVFDLPEPLAAAVHRA